MRKTVTTKFLFCWDDNDKGDNDSADDEDGSGCSSMMRVTVLIV